MRSWLQDPDGDGIYSFHTRAIPAGTYDVKVAHGRSWDENYGPGGQRDGPNIPFEVADGQTVELSYEIATHLLTISAN